MASGFAEIKNAIGVNDMLVMPINQDNGVPLSVTRLQPGQSGSIELTGVQSIRIDLVSPGADSPANDSI